MKSQRDLPAHEDRTPASACEIRSVMWTPDMVLLQRRLEVVDNRCLRWILADDLSSIKVVLSRRLQRGRRVDTRSVGGETHLRWTGEILSFHSHGGHRNVLRPHFSPSTRSPLFVRRL